MEDTDLVQGALAGRREDFEALVERYQRVLYALAYRYLDNADAADEVVQVTFVQAYTNLAGFRHEASFKTWLTQIALNQCRALRRSVQQRSTVSLDDLDEAHLADPTGRAESRAWRSSLQTLVSRLPPRQRSVLTLRLFADLPFREVARAEGISETSAKASYHYALKRLRQWLSRDD